MNNLQENIELEHKYLCQHMNTSIQNHTQELSAAEKKKAYRQAYCERNKERIAAYQKLYNKAYRETDREKILNQREKYYQDNKEKIKTKVREYSAANRDKISKQNKLYRVLNNEAVRVKEKTYYESNKEKWLKQRRDRKKEIHKNNPLEKVKYLLRANCYKAFARIKKSKPTNTIKLLGCTWEEAKVHFELLFQEGMTWDNHGKWHIDHIRPVSSFTEEDIHMMNHISNLQPLWAEDNIKKSNWYGEINPHSL